MADADERIKCWALGARLQESVQFLRSSTELMADTHDTDIALIHRGIMDAQIRNIDKLLRDSESCGVEANGFISGQFAGIQEAVKTLPPRKLANLVKEFSLQLHTATSEEVTHTTG